MNRIRILPDALANQIAAGEVVERPASVVKELIENALDAGARAISIRLAGGGAVRVEVEDDGCGMSPDDALLSLERHATSKVSAAEDLARITTMGFRGEALPSIGAASRLTIETAESDGVGTRIEVDFGRIVSVRPHGRPRGTRLVVEDLFARLPARRKFLRSEATELRHVMTAITAIAFARPDVALAVEHNRKPLLQLPPATSVAKRLPDLVGARRARGARPLDHTAGSLVITGFLLPPAGQREIVIVVNQRPVRDRLLVATLGRALRGPAGVAEADAFVAIRIPPDQVDVNVHPAKAEVRFVEPGRVVAAVTRAVAAARPELHGPVPVQRIVTVPAAGDWDDRGQRGTGEGGYEVRAFEALWAREGQRPFESSELSPPAMVSTSGARYIGQYHATYLLLENGDGLLLVDQHAAHERVIYERLLASPTAAAAQPLLIPELVELSPAHAALVTELTTDLRALGLEVEPVSGNAVRVHAVPAALPPTPAARLLSGMLADVAAGAAPGATVRERAAASLACHAAIKKSWPLSPVEAERLLDDLGNCHEKNRCPHGRPILIGLTHAEIERRIGRR